jgi:hypothetical protein
MFGSLQWPNLKGSSTFVRSVREEMAGPLSNDKLETPQRFDTGGGMVSESGSDEAALFKSYTNLQHINPAFAKKILEEAKEILGSLGIPFFLRQGTCLGAVRDQAFIPWDDDVDLGSVMGLNGLTEDMLDPVRLQRSRLLCKRGKEWPLDCRGNYEVSNTRGPNFFPHH